MAQRRSGRRTRSRPVAVEAFRHLRRSWCAGAACPAGRRLLLGPAWLWTLLVVAVVALPTLLSTLIELVRKPAERDWLVHLSLTSKSAAARSRSPC